MGVEHPLEHGQLTGNHSPKEERSSLPLAAFNENYTSARVGPYKLLLHLCWKFGWLSICSGKSNNSPDTSGRRHSKALLRILDLMLLPLFSSSVLSECWGGGVDKDILEG